MAQAPVPGIQSRCRRFETFRTHSRKPQVRTRNGLLVHTDLEASSVTEAAPPAYCRRVSVSPDRTTKLLLRALLLFHSGMDWTTIGTGVAAVAAVVAALISLALFLASRRQERRSVENDKRNLFLSLNEQLMQPDLQRGRDILRRRVNSKRDAEVLYHRKRDDHWTVSQAVAMFDLLGLYVSREYVDRDLVVAEWGRCLPFPIVGMEIISLKPGSRNSNGNPIRIMPNWREK